MVIKIFRNLSEEKAFTLIEVIVSLILVSIMAAIAGFGFVQITQGYIFAKQNSETVQKAQIAMTRIDKELGAAEPQTSTATAITVAGTQTVSYTRRESRGASTVVSNTISITGGLVQMSGTTLGTLINNVVMDTSLSKFAYFDALGNSTTTLANIRRIDITLRVTGADNQASDFTDSVWINESY